MALTSTDERDLLVTLYGSINDRRLWPEFAGKLLARTHAQRVSVLMRRRDSGEQPRQQIFAGWGAGHSGPLDISSLSAAGLLPYASLRPHRVYALEEMQVGDAEQDALLNREGFTYARFIRIALEGQDIWVILVQDDRDFAAADSALLSAIAPHMAAALESVNRIETLQLRAAMAEEALALLGIGQAALGVDGGVIEADAVARGALDAGGRGSEWLAEACAELGGASPEERRFTMPPGAQSDAVMLRAGPAVDPTLLAPIAATVLMRTQRPTNAVNTAKAIANLHGLSNREAALAEAICRGLSIVEAGTSLRLTPETARNYSKRIYAKTGTRGQADLVRLILNGLAPLG